ncbi:MAG: DNA phosphorothioation-associated putative methyltransferase [Burkholderiales bacterium]|nr:DNA phosphorothioation-associated putative methyltransferase [Burkholderiales bacterium]
MFKVGKRVVDDFYIHMSAVSLLEQAERRHTIEQALLRLPPLEGGAPNVAKLNLSNGRLSLLSYADFDSSPFPELQASWVFDAGTDAPPRFRSYTESLNPPILHRKELLVAPYHPDRDVWAALTRSAEDIGLFDDTKTIGFRTNWERLVASKGYTIVGHKLYPLANAVDAGADPDASGPADRIQRHLTALTRSSLSAPVQLLLRHGLLAAESLFFDYGCGRGNDLATLRGDGYKADGWDPHFAPEEPLSRADVVNLGFVINVIEDPGERVEALCRAFGLAKKILSVAVMLGGGEPQGKPFADGVLTTRRTFQKYFSQAEFKDYLETSLQQDAFMVGPGVAFVFPDKDLEQRFCAGRYRRRGISERLLARRPPRVPRPAREPAPRAPTVTRSEAALEKARPVLDALWKTCLDLGRLPEAAEVADLQEIDAQLGGLGKALLMLRRHYDQSQLSAAASARTEDLRLYFAAQQFSKAQPYKHLEHRLRRDVKAFFGDYRSAQSAGLNLLLEAADVDRLLAACRDASTQGIGWLDADHSLQLHVSLVERLPVVLRAYVACGFILWDAGSEVQIVKIHIHSGKLTLLEFDDFDADPVPALRRRIKVNIRRQHCDVFEYGTSEYPKPLLYRKARYLHEDCAGYAEQLAFDEALEATGLLDDSDHGPTSSDLHRRLEERRLSMRGGCLARSDTIPPLDQRCGEHFTFRSFVECGETQTRLGIHNVPLRAETYNALYDLATCMLDPVIEYFGPIRLTYGFCSTSLSRQIAKRIAPDLDQHAACEVNTRGKMICGRGGAACDFLVEDEDMREVADWIVENLPYDRLYYYGRSSPIHVSFGPQLSAASYEMRPTPRGTLMPAPLQPSRTAP